jgi:hypothetical protein
MQLAAAPQSHERMQSALDIKVTTGLNYLPLLMPKIGFFCRFGEVDLQCSKTRDESGIGVVFEPVARK